MAYVATDLAGTSTAVSNNALVVQFAYSSADDFVGTVDQASYFADADGVDDPRLYDGALIYLQLGDGNRIGRWNSANSTVDESIVFA